MKFTRICFAIGLGIVAVNFGFAAWLYPRLPNPVPTHWNSAGVIDGYTPKPWGVFEGSIIMVLLWAVLLVAFLVVSRIGTEDQQDLLKTYFGPLQLGIMLIVCLILSEMLWSVAKSG